MRDLTLEETRQIGGGFTGIPIPFTNGFIPGANWPGGLPRAITAAGLAWNIGTGAGDYINKETAETFGMTTAEAIYRSTDG